MPVTDEPHSAREKERVGGERERDKDGERRQGKETVVVLRRFKERVSRLGVIIDTTIMHGEMDGAMEGGKHRRSAHLSNELLLTIMAMQFEYN